ncbi:MAG: SUMF1/EgtB/PvdO family nonheme iron enzyme [bacterium]|nr:SUMF1/EgtB/PvdO family nonheme iron enzyme [bacterium]
MNPARGTRALAGDALVTALREIRERVVDATRDLDDDQWRVPYDPGVQPVAWDLAHIGWFAEFWMLRGPHRIATDGLLCGQPGQFFPRDDRYDSARVDHVERWRMPLYERTDVYARLERQLEACAHALQDADDATLWGGRIALLHECMHHEAMLWTRDLLGYPAVAGYEMPTITPREPVQIAGRELTLGRDPDDGFVFDNETPPHRVQIAEFSIDATPVTNGQFLEFVDAGGYDEPRFWRDAGARFRESIERQHPARWRRRNDGNHDAAHERFEQRWFDCWQPLALDEPICHVTAFEAEAYCAFRGRRLPTAAEWEAAATEVDWGRTVWEWTSTPFAPYPNFQPSPYTTYSAPWFHAQRELRGGAFATDPHVHDRAYRNFFLPDRTDVFAGFRTAGD